MALTATTLDPLSPYSLSDTFTTFDLDLSLIFDVFCYLGLGGYENSTYLNLETFYASIILELRGISLKPDLAGLGLITFDLIPDFTPDSLLLFISSCL